MSITIVLHPNDGQIEAHQHIGQRQVPNDHGDCHILVAIYETTPEHHQVTHYGQYSHAPRGVAQRGFTQQILKRANAICFRSTHEDFRGHGTVEEAIEDNVLQAAHIVNGLKIDAVKRNAG